MAADLPIAQEDIALLCALLDRLADYAGSVVRRHQLGLREEVVAAHLSATRARIESTLSRLSAGPARLRPAGEVPLAHSPGPEAWDFRQTLRYATGAAMISQRYVARMAEADVSRSLLAKVLYKCQTGILDDVVDRGAYSYIEVRDLYQHVLSSMTAPRYDQNLFRAKLAMLLQQEQFAVYDLTSNITASFNRLFLSSPRGFEFFAEMERLDHQVSLGQALSVLQKRPFLDLPRVRSITAALPAPAADLRWHERLANYVSGGTRYNLIDLCFTTVADPLEDIGAMLDAWYYFDAVIVYLNNVVAIEQDLREGIVNLSLVAMRESETQALRDPTGYDPHLADEDYLAHFERLGELLDRGLRHALDSGTDTDQYYPFIATMIPVVMMAEWIGTKDEYIDAFVATVAPSIREAAKAAATPAIPEVIARYHTR